MRFKILFFCLFISIQVFAQPDRRILIVSSEVGESINLLEKEKYKLFPFVKNELFKSAQFILYSDSSIVLKITFKNDSIWNKASNESEFFQIRQKINHQAYAEYLNKNADFKPKSKKFPFEKNQNSAPIENPISSEYFFATSAIPLQKGKGIYQNNNLLFNSASYGLGNYFSLDAGATFILPAFYVMPKVSFPIKKNIYAGVSGFYGKINRNDFSLINALITFGNSNNNISLVVGHGFIRRTLLEKPLININGIVKLGKRFGLKTECWMVPNVNIWDLEQDYRVIFSSSMRFYTKKANLDLSLLIIPINDFVIPIPNLGFSYKF